MRPGHETPINATAARVMGRGVTYERSKGEGDTLYQDTPLAMRSPTALEAAAPTFQDLQGMRFGRFTVLGQAADHPKRWVVRCACGVYGLRSARAIRNPKNDADACADCRHLIYLQRKERWRRTGRDEHDRAFV